MSPREFAVMAVLVAGASAAVAQVTPVTPPASGSREERVGSLLPAGVESAAEAAERVANYTPDPVKYPVPRTSWDGKPDFSGVYWPGVNITPPPVPLESLYRPEARDYREGGGAARGLIDWRGIDSPAYHCWPPSPANGSMALSLQLVSAPGFLLMVNEGGGTFRIIRIVGDITPQPDQSRRPSFMGSSVGYWEGDTLVVEVTKFNGRPWLGGARPPSQPPQTSSSALRVTERWSRPDGRTFEYQAVIDDAEMLTAAWTGPVHRRGMLPYDTIQEALCFPDPELYARHREFAASAAGRRTGGPGPGRGGRGARGGGR